MTHVFIKLRNVNIEKYTRKDDVTQAESHMRREVWSKASSIQGTPKIPVNYQKLGRRKKRFIYWFQKDHDFAKTVIWGF